MNLDTLTIADPQAGSIATILPGFGFNCFSFLAAPAGKPFEVLWAAPSFETGQHRPSHSGIPILSPFPGRIGGTAFHFQGRSYPLPPGDALGNAIHGFVLNRPWQVIEQTQNRVVGQFQASRADPALLNCWPADFRLTVEYGLSGNTLASRIRVENPDTRPLPWGLGTHPYFRIPLGEDGRADRCTVTVPAGEYWELSNMLATGRRLPADGPRALRSGLPFPQTHLDDVFTGLEFKSGKCVTTIDDAASGRRLTMAFDALFRACVVYNPPHREAICIEPYTCVPDAFRLAESGIDAGGRVLGPGETATAEIEIRVD